MLSFLFHSVECCGMLPILSTIRYSYSSRSWNHGAALWRHNCRGRFAESFPFPSCFLPADSEFPRSYRCKVFWQFSLMIFWRLWAIVWIHATMGKSIPREIQPSNGGLVLLFMNNPLTADWDTLPKFNINMDPQMAKPNRKSFFRSHFSEFHVKFGACNAACTGGNVQWLVADSSTPRNRNVCLLLHCLLIVGCSYEEVVCAWRKLSVRAGRYGIQYVNL